ncbi:unnamed protein product, partial [Heterosigma akashiwo]
VCSQLAGYAVLPSAGPAGRGHDERGDRLHAERLVPAGRHPGLPPRRLGG